MLPVNADTMRQVVMLYKGIAGNEQNRIITGIGPLLANVLNQYGINTPLRIAHFLAQCAEESAGYRTLIEFSSGLQYEGRSDLGNTQPGDGPRFRGRGLIEITGRKNYMAVGVSIGQDLVAHPEYLEIPEQGLRASCVFWQTHELNDYADDDDIVGETQEINGGLNGLASRRAYLAKAKRAVAALVAGPLVPTAGHPILHRGMDNADVGKVQLMLRQNGFPLLAVDNDFGGATETAVAAFQWELDLDDDGIVGPDTWRALDALPRPKA